MAGSMPAMSHAGCYASVLHYLKAAADMGAAAAKADGAAAVARMKAMPTDDDCFGAGRIREDGRKIHPVLPLRGEVAGRLQGAVGLLQAAADDTGG